MFYLTPKKQCKSESEVWYTKDISIGKHSLCNVVSNFCIEVGIKEYKTNHSLSTTACSLALSMGVPDKFIMDRTIYYGTSIMKVNIMDWKFECR